MRVLFTIMVFIFSARVFAGQGDAYLCEVGISAWINKDTIIKSPIGINKERFRFLWSTEELTVVKIGVEAAEFILEDKMLIKTQSEFDVFAVGHQTLVHFDDSTKRMFMSVQTFDNITSVMATCKKL